LAVMPVGMMDWVWMRARGLHLVWLRGYWICKKAFGTILPRFSSRNHIHRTQQWLPWLRQTISACHENIQAGDRTVWHAFSSDIDIVSVVGDLAVPGMGGWQMEIATDRACTP
jgi:hypothetical protein